MKQLNKTYTRLTSEHRGSHSKKDAALNINCIDKDKLILSPQIKTVILNFDVALRQYMSHTDIQEFHPEFQYTTLKIQKT